MDETGTADRSATQEDEVTHEVVVFQHDNGELGEALVLRQPLSDEGVEAGIESFPASDAPAGWAGEDARDREPRSSDVPVRRERVRASTPMATGSGAPT